MSKSDQEKIKQAVDLLIDKDTDLTSFFAKDGMLKGERLGNPLLICNLF